MAWQSPPHSERGLSVTGRGISETSIYQTLLLLRLPVGAGSCRDHLHVPVTARATVRALLMEINTLFLLVYLWQIILYSFLSYQVSLHSMFKGSRACYAVVQAVGSAELPARGSGEVKPSQLP